ncbi:MAG: aspartate 1-decarboxylase [Demequinaceae bacterium]|nr:aspartate 1-decarboxylase [Demequinaceae bacterium]
MMISKIHRATVTQADLHYVGSITIDASLMEAADLLPGQRVDVLDVTNGARLTTYAIPGNYKDGQICINGAAAHHIHPGDIIIILAYGYLGDEDARRFDPTVVFVDAENAIVKVCHEPGEVPADSDLKPSGRGLAGFRESGWPAYRE